MKNPNITPEFETIYAALNNLMKACGLHGESGTEELFEALETAMHNVDWLIVIESHCQGLFQDVNCLLAHRLVSAITNSN